MFSIISSFIFPPCLQIIIASFSFKRSIFSRRNFSHRDNNTIDTSVEYLFAIILPPRLFSLHSSSSENSIYLLIYFTSILLRFAHKENCKRFSFFFSFILAVIMVFVKENLYTEQLYKWHRRKI